MPNTRDIRNRIRGVKNTAKITRAMQLVASSKMKRAQDTALQGRPYAELLSRLLLALRQQVAEIKHPFLAPRVVKTRGILVISTDRGLCGALNSNLFREITKITGDARFYSIGKKGRQFLSRTQRPLAADFIISEEAPFKEFRPVIEAMLDAYLKEEIDSIEILYPRYRNTLIQEPKLTPFLPFQHFTEALEARLEAESVTVQHDDREFLFEPDAASILEPLLDLFIKRETYQLLIDARASEHSARMVAMKAATDNAKKLTDQLTLQYNKARQAGITQEILEITAAAKR